jgi:Major capsid protein N-terminus
MPGALLELMSHDGHNDVRQGEKVINSLYAATQPMRFANSSHDIYDQVFDKYITIGRNGDLMSQCHLKLELVSIHSYQSIDNIFDLIEEVRYESGGQLIERFNGDCMRAESAYDSQAKPIIDKSTVIIPLHLCTGKREETYLPLICLRFHEVLVFVKLKDEYQSTVLKKSMLVSYVALDALERRLMVRSPKSFTIHPKTLIADRRPFKGTACVPIGLSSRVRDIIVVSDKPLKTLQLLMRPDVSRFDVKEACIFQKLFAQRYYGLPCNDQHIYFMPFDSTPLSVNVSGSLNFRDMGDATMKITPDNESDTFKLTIMAHSCKVMYFASGMSRIREDTEGEMEKEKEKEEEKEEDEKDEDEKDEDEKEKKRKKL